MSLLTPVFSGYEWLRSADPRAWWQDRSLRRTMPDGLPLPPAYLIMKVAGTPRVPVYLDGGQRAAAAIREMMARAGAPVETLSSLLDFGCGSGRVLRCWKDLRSTTVHGTDYNPDLVDWCRENLTFAKVGRNQLMPPLAYADASFDLVYVLSVFTHLPEEAERQWMKEFRRVLRPGGWLLFSTHGSSYLDRLKPAERVRFEQGQLVVRAEGDPGSNLCCTYHPESYVRGSLAAGWQVVEHVPEGARGNPRQDAWLLRARPVDLPS